MNISLFKTYLPYNRQEPFALAVMGNSARRKVKKLNSRLNKVIFDLRPYNLPKMKFNELFKLKVTRDFRSPIDTTIDFKVTYVGIELNPSSRHDLISFCARLIKYDDGCLRSQLYAWQLACDNIFGGMMDCLTSFLRFLLEDLYVQNQQLSSIPDSIDVCCKWCGDLRRYALYAHTYPKDVEVLVDVAKKTNINGLYEVDAVQGYERYIIDELATSAIKKKISNADLTEPDANVLLFQPWYEQYMANKAWVDKKNNCTETIDKISKRIIELKDVANT